MPSTTSSSLISRIQQNDQAAWSRLEFLYRPLIVYWCRRCPEDVRESDIDDIVQDTFISVHKYIDRFVGREDKVSFRPWLRSIVNSRISDHRKRAERRVPSKNLETVIEQLLCDPKATDPTNTDNETETQIMFRRILEVIKQDFQPQTLKAFYLTAMEKMSASEAAEKLGMTPANVRKAKSNVSKRFKEELERIKEEFWDFFD